MAGAPGVLFKFLPTLGHTFSYGFTFHIQSYDPSGGDVCGL